MSDIATKEPKSSVIPWWAPLGAGVLAGAGGYGLARRISKGPKGSELAKIRELAKGSFSRGDLTQMDDIALSKLSPLQRAIRKLRFGPEVDAEGLEALSKSKVPKAVWQRDAIAEPGTFNPALGAGTNEGRAYDIVQDMEDKLLEADVLQKYAPGTVAKTFGLQDFLKRRGIKLRKGKYIEEDLASLQKALQEEFKDTGYLIKTRGGHAIDENVASSGRFPTEETNLVDSLKQWRAMRPDFVNAKKSTPGAINTVIEQFRTKPGYEGRVIEELLKDNVILQEKLPLMQYGKSTAAKMKAKGFSPTREFRVHVVGGQAIPYMATPRYPSVSLTFLKDMYDARKASKWMQKNVLDKLPQEYKGISMGADVAPLRGGGYRVIETNTGGSSGLLDVPGMPHALHKAVTGRFSRPAATALGTAAAGGVTGLGYGVKAIASPDENKGV
jgi:hypothetical protein